MTSASAPRRDLDGRELVGDLDGADLAPGQAGLVGDRADEVLRTDLGRVAEADEDRAWSARSLRRPLPRAVGAASAVRSGPRVGISRRRPRPPLGLVRQLHRGQRDLHQVVVVGEGVDDDAVLLVVAPRGSAASQRGPGELEAAGPQVGDGRQRLRPRSSAWSPSRSS